MKKFVIFLCLLLLCWGSSVYSYPVRVGILPFKNSSGFVIYPDKYTVQDVFGMNFSKEVADILMCSPRFEVFMAREDDKPANYLVGGEIVRCFFHTSNFVGSSARAEVWVNTFMLKGNRTIFRRLFIGRDTTYSPVYNPKSVKAWSDLYHTALGGAIRNAAVLIAGEISSYLPLVGKVIGVTKEGNVIIDIGEHEGVRKGMLFVLKESKNLKKVPAVWGKVVVKLKVVEVDKHNSLLCPLLSVKKFKVKKGDILVHGIYP